jgi:CRP-like cAMP-binding protein
LALPVRQTQVGAGKDFVRQGEQIDQACLVACGLIAGFDQGADGKRHITSLYIAGDMPNLHSLVQDEATQGLQAICTTTLLQVRHSDLRALTSAYPAIGEALWREGTRDISIMAQWIVNLGRRRAYSRIAHFLCEIAWRMGVVQPESSTDYRLDLTQSHLAEITGMTTVHVNRTLRMLRSIGTNFQAKRVTISDWSALAGAGEFDPNYLQVTIKPREPAQNAA